MGYVQKDFCVVSLLSKKCEKLVKIAIFQVSAILKFDFQKRKQLHFFYKKII